MAIREGKWRCPYCSQVNRGADLACRGCGATRDKDVAFFLEEDADEVTDAAHLAVAQAGADWLCAFCSTSNRPGQAACANCGAEKGTSPSRPVQDVVPPIPPPPLRPLAGHSVVPAGLKLGVAVVVLLVLGVCSFVGYRLFRKTEERVTVIGHEWERSIDVEALRTVREEAWDGEVPSGARVRERRRAVHHTENVQTGTERVKVGTRDLGNGFFEDVYEDRPVYQRRDVHATKVVYDIDRWVRARTVKAQAADAAARWPDAALGSNERAGPRQERYVLVLEGAERRYRMTFSSHEAWAAYTPGRTYTAVIRGGSTVLELK